MDVDGAVGGIGVENTIDDSKFYAVYPKTTCSHLEAAAFDDDASKIDTRAPCLDCGSTQENWICLHCYGVFCGRYINEHMMLHSIENEHPLVLSFSDLSVWCYPCESYIDNPKLYNFKNLAHMDKFGEELVWSYSQNRIDMKN